MNKQYKHIFFDLDHTLWDFDANARETLLELYDTYELANKQMPHVEVFIDTYTKNNHLLWADYHKGIITKEQLRQTRFRKTFAELGMNEQDIPLSFEEDYVRICPTKMNLFEHTHQTLKYLTEKYRLHIITNGFLESSTLKMSNTGLTNFFDSITVSEVVGMNKPDPAIFQHALENAKAEKHESIMIGDSLEADITGALAIGMDCIFFNPQNQPHDYIVTHEIKSLNELIKLL